MTERNLPYPLIPAAQIQVDMDAPILEAIKVIDASPARIALAVDAGGKMVGSLTDGDIRRALLKGSTLASPVKEAMHGSPAVMPVAGTRQEVIEHMQAAQVKQMPIVETDGRLVGIAVYDMLSGFERMPRSNPVIIMAGGRGKRLMPITTDIPKPMVEVGGKPMLEHIIRQFTKQGFGEFHIALNYLGHVIEDYFGDGNKWDCRIRYLREQEFLGTAGALSLLGKSLREPFIVINGDILTSVDFCDLLDYHATSASTATVCARQHRMEVPYGVIQLKDGMLQAIVEKPVYEDMVSAGIYAFDPDVLRYIPEGRATDMPAVLLSLVQDKRKVAVFPMREDWVDIGRCDDLERAKLNFAGN